MAVVWLRPDEYNYLAYAIVLVAAGGGAAVLHRGAHVRFMVGFTGWMILSATYSTVVLHPSPYYSLLLLPIGLLGMSLLGSDDGGARAGVILRGLLSFAAVQSLLGLIQTLFDVPAFAALGGIVYSEPRNYLAMLLPGMSSQVRMATGTFEHFNGLGALLCLVAPIAFGGWLHSRARWRPVLLIVVMAGLVATFSRGALLGALIGVSLVYWSETRSTKAKVLRRVPLALTGILVAMALYGAVAVSYTHLTLPTKRIV